MFTYRIYPWRTLLQAYPNATGGSDWGGGGADWGRVSIIEVKVFLKNAWVTSTVINIFCYHFMQTKRNKRAYFEVTRKLLKSVILKNILHHTSYVCT